MNRASRSGEPPTRGAALSLGVLAGVVAIAACASRGGGAPAGASEEPGDASAPFADAGDAGTSVVAPPVDGGGGAPNCDGVPPPSLACTGLYADVAAKTIAPGIQPFTPAVPLWSDGSGKNRWVMLPPGQAIDRSAPNDWVFPVGTKFWKEFTRDGRRMETRLFQKGSDGTWAWVSYVWNADESAATATPAGASLPVGDGATYVVPSQQQCTECHDGRPEHIMGFEEVSLGSPGATGLTLGGLASQGLLSPPPVRTSLSVADDGSGDVAHALGWLHINCGVPCHNANTVAGGNAVDMRLRLDANELDGRPATHMAPVVTTVGVPTSTGLWGQLDLIQPGDPADSLLVYLVSTRGAGRQMPPLASSSVDVADVAILRDWISKMSASALDGGPGDASDDAAGGDDAAVDAADAGPADASTDAAGSD